MVRKLFIICVYVLHVNQARAQIYENSKQPTAGGNEFFVGREYGKPLVKVNLISGVQKPGVYHVPIGTDLAEVIAYAGGASEKANLQDITILRGVGSARTSLDFDLEKRLSKSGVLPTLNDQDIVHIPIDHRMDRTLNWIGIVSGLASIALAVTIIDEHKR